MNLVLKTNVFSKISLLGILSLALVAAPSAYAKDEVKDVGDLLDRIENAWSKHDADALADCISDQGFLGIVSRPGNPEGAWVGDKKACQTQLDKVWSNVVRREFVEREIVVSDGAARMRLAVAERLADGQRRLSRCFMVAVKEGDRWKVCLSMPDVALLKTDDQRPDGNVLRLFPTEGSTLIPADQPHPLKERWLDAFRGFVTADWRRVTAIDCPAGTLAFSPAADGVRSPWTGRAIFEATRKERRRLQRNYDLAAAELQDAALICRDDAAMATARWVLPARSGNGAKTSLARWAVFVRQQDDWRLAATLPWEAEIGPPVERVDPTTVRQSIEGRLVGVGVALELADGGVRIKQVLPNSPAQQVGIEAGTHITAIDGKPLAGLSLSEVVERIRGPEGAAVSFALTLPDGSAQTVELIRANVVVASVETRDLGDGVFLLRIASFNQLAPKEAREKLQSLRSQGMKGLVLDLRGPAGGTPESAKACTSLFLPPGMPLWGIHMDGSPDKQITAAGPSFPRLPCIVLIDGKTHGAGALAAYAIQKYHRARLIGQKTAELGRMKKLVVGDDGKGRLVEHGHFLSPDGQSLVGHVVEPNIAVAADAGEKALLEQAVAILRPALEKDAPADAPQPADSRRTWTDATGKHRIEAEFLGLADGVVRLKKSDGAVVDVPLEKLSEADRAIIESAGRKSHRTKKE